MKCCTVDLKNLENHAWSNINCEEGKRYFERITNAGYIGIRARKTGDKTMSYIAYIFANTLHSSYILC